MRDVDPKIYPYYSDSKFYFDIMKRFVKSFIDNHWKSDWKLFADEHILNFYEDIHNSLGINTAKTKKNFIDLLTNLFVIVTGFHEHVGTVTDFLMDPTFGCTRIEKGYEVCSKQGYVQMSALVVLTQFKQVDLLSDWSHLLKDKYGFDETDRNNYKIFKEELVMFAKKIEDRNKETEYKSNSFNPNYLQVSVSL